MTVPNTEKRRAARIALNAPILVEAIGQPETPLHENLRKVYQRVKANTHHIGSRFPCILSDLSTNGAFISGSPLPLLSRVSFLFKLEGYGQVEAVGWTLWRREADCEVPRADGTIASLPMGFGVLFEAISVDARIAIHNLVAS